MPNDSTNKAIIENYCPSDRPGEGKSRRWIDKLVSNVDANVKTKNIYWSLITGKSWEA